MTSVRTLSTRRWLAFFGAFAALFVLGVGPTRALTIVRSAPTPSPEVGYLPEPHAVRVDSPTVKLLDLHIPTAKAVITLSDGTVIGNDPNYRIVEVQASDINLANTHVYQPSPTDPLPRVPYTLNIQNAGPDLATGVDLGPGVHDTVFMHIVNLTGCLDVLAGSMPAPLSTLFTQLASLLPQACLPLTEALPPNPLTPAGESVFDLVAASGLTIPSIVLTDLQADVFALTVKNDNANPANTIAQDAARLPLLHIRVCDGAVSVADCAAS